MMAEEWFVADRPGEYYLLCSNDHRTYVVEGNTEPICCYVCQEVYTWPKSQTKT